MEVIDRASADKRYAQCIEVSKRIRWDIDRDVIRDRVTSAQMQSVGAGLAPLSMLQGGHHETRIGKND
jgi:hypothetical protein